MNFEKEELKLIAFSINYRRQDVITELRTHANNPDFNNSDELKQELSGLTDIWGRIQIYFGIEPHHKRKSKQNKNEA